MHLARLEMRVLLNAVLDLLARQSDEADDEAAEPPVPTGLGHMSASLQAIVDFLKIDEDLIAMAAASSPSIEEPEGMAEWIASLPTTEKAALLSAGRCWGRRAGPGTASAPLPGGQGFTTDGQQAITWRGETCQALTGYSGAAAIE